MISTAPKNLSELQELVENLFMSAKQAGLQISLKAINPEFHPAPHRQPVGLPLLKQALYWFSIEGICLKVGKAGPNSNARYTSQHYNPRSSNSNLAKSILTRSYVLKEVLPAIKYNEIDMLNEETVGMWIKDNTSRCNLLIDAALNQVALSFLETFVQVRLSPLYEGRTSRRVVQPG